MNHEVDGLRRDPREVAQAFLAGLAIASAEDEKERR
jgi:hypothetical protein